MNEQVDQAWQETLQDSLQIHEPPDHLFDRVMETHQVNKRRKMLRNFGGALSLVLALGLTWVIFNPSKPNPELELAPLIAATQRLEDRLLVYQSTQSVPTGQRQYVAATQASLAELDKELAAAYQSEHRQREVAELWERRITLLEQLVQSYEQSNSARSI